MCRDSGKLFTCSGLIQRSSYMENKSQQGPASNRGHMPASERLKNLKEEIIEKWKDRLCSEIPAANSQSPSELRNSVPQFIDTLCKYLTPEALKPFHYDEVNEISQEHGEQRAGLAGYSLIQMLKEYQILREVIISSLEEQGPITNSERDIILTSIEMGMAEAGQHFEFLSLRESKTSRAIIDGIRDHAIIRLDNNGRIQDWNAGAENLFGWKKEEVLGKNCAFIFTPEDRDKKEDFKEKEVASREGRAEDRRWHIKKDGSRFFANGIMNSLIDNDRNIYGFIKVLRDDTERLKIEEQKKEAELQAESTRKQLYSFFTQSPTPMVILEGPDHYIHLANKPYEKLVGRKVTGKTALEAFTSEEIKHFMPMLDGVYKTGKPFIGKEIPLDIPDESGEIVKHWVNVNYFPHFDENGNVKGILCDVHEVTDLVISREKIEQSEELFRTLANSLPIIIWTARPDGFVDWYNDWWHKYLEKPKGTLWDDPENSPMHPDDVARTWPLWRESLATGKPFNIEQRFKKGSTGQYRWHLVRGVPVVDSKGNIDRWIGANTDIHDHRELVNRLEEERELRERFVAALSHDLRTPLTAAKLSAQVMRKFNPNDEKILRTSDRIVGNLDRVDGMIQDLLDASRLSAGEKLPIKCEEADLSAIIHTTVEDLRHLHGNRFEIFEESDTVEGCWDINGIRRIIENLCNNAIKYGDGTSPINIRIGHSSKDVALFSVQNSGKVIPPEDRVQLFQPYKRASDAHTSGKKGWGIGLMLVKGVVDAHEGTVEVTSTEESGTTFTVRLPIKK